ncbi:MAG: hypothetical protein HC930_01630 [Hydrococcus sp. SU_1_0]|nr:hypothetical protein [Hydrococcus sp. SU_1_0]NJO96203.1 hypothetical protein [Pleurocapsa sp. CRU_1_2]
MGSFLSEANSLCGVQLIDANGDGRKDLLVTTPDLSGYYLLTFQGATEE